MARNRVIGVELVVDDKGTVKLVRFSREAQAAFAKAAQGAGRLDGSMKQADGAMARLERRAGTLTGKMALLGGAFTRLRQAGGVVWGTFRRVSGAVFNLKTALVGLGLGYVAGDFIKVADNTDRMKIALDQLTGGKGEEWFQKLNEWAFKMPVNTDKAIQAFIRLRSFGLTPTIKQMNTLVDATIGVGRGEEALESVSRALGQIAARGKLSAEELNQLAEAGLPAKEMLAAAFKTTTAALENMITKGLIPSKLAVQALIEQMELRFGGASSKMQQKWAGLTDALKSHWADIQRNVMGPGGVMGYLEKSLGRVVAKLDELRSSGRLREWAERAGQAVEKALQRGVSFVEGIINNWSAWEARWEKFKRGAKEVWQQTKNVASVVGSLLKTVLEGWTALPTPIREFGLLGALIGGKKAKLALGGLVGLEIVAKKLKDFKNKLKEEGGTSATVVSIAEILQGATLKSIIRNYLVRATLGAKEGQPPKATLAAPPKLIPYKDLVAQLMAEVEKGLSVQHAGATGATAAAAARAGTDFRAMLGSGSTDKDIAKINAAVHKQTEEYIKMIADSVDLEKQIRRQGMTAQERNLDKLKDKYETTQERIDDLVLGGVYTEEQATGLKAKLNLLYLGEVEKAQAKHDQSLLRSIQLNGLRGRDLKLAQLRFEIQDLEQAGHSAILVEQYKAQRLEEINKGWLERTLDTWGDMETVIPEATRNMLQGVQGALSNYLASSLSDFESFTDAIEATWRNMLAQLVSQWFVSGFAGLVKDFINLLKGGSGWENTLKGVGLDSLLGGGKTASSAAGAAGNAGGIIAGIKALFGGGGSTATQAANLGIGLGLETGMTGAAGGAGAAGKLAVIPGLAGPGAAMGAALGPGLAGMLMSPDYLNVFGWSQMSPEEARERIMADLGFVDRYIEAMERLGQAVQPFNEGIRGAIEDIDKFAERAGYTKEQLEAMTGALGANTAQAAESARAANTLEEQVRSLTQQMHAAENSYTMTSVAARDYDRQIMDLARRMGLTKEEASSFRERIWELSKSFTTGGEEATAFDRKLSDLIAATLTPLSEQVGMTTEGFRGLADAINGIPRNIEVGINVTRTGDDYTGVISQAAGALGIGSFHQGGPVLHGGGFPFSGPWASYEELMRLAGDEVVAKLRLGEYVIREQAVNIATRSWLDFVNREARPPVIAEPVVVPLAVQAPASPQREISPAANPTQPTIINLTVVTPDGRVLRQETYQDMERGGGPRPKKLEVRL